MGKNMKKHLERWPRSVKIWSSLLWTVTTSRSLRAETWENSRSWLVGWLVGWSWEWDRWIYFWWLGGDQKWEDDLGVSGTETEATNVQNQAGDIDEQVVFTGATPTFQPDLSPWWDTSALARCRTVHSTDAMTCCVTPRYGQTGAGKTYTLHGTPQEALWSCRCQWVYPLGCWDVQEESFYKL